MALVARGVSPKDTGVTKSTSPPSLVLSFLGVFFSYLIFSLSGSFLGCMCLAGLLLRFYVPRGFCAYVIFSPQSSMCFTWSLRLL
uniref:Uncharacterized protein n=1 Tax=Manihot esculenta TaxID=3983 RepID=A0A2C9VFR4_MANES